MSTLLLPSRRVVQPQGPVEIDGKFASGLVFAYNGATDSLASNAVGKAFTGTKTNSVGKPGKAASFNGSTDFLNITGTSANLPNGTTFLYFAKRRASTGVQQVLVKRRGTEGMESGLYNTFASPPSRIYTGFWNGSASVGPTLGYVNGKKDSLNGTFDTVVDEWYCVAGTCSIIVDFLANWELARNSAGTLYYGAVDIALAAVWNKQFPEAVVKSLSDNPWQIFKDVQRRTWFPAPTGPFVPKATVTLYAENGTTPKASVTGLQWAFWDSATPNLALAPSVSGTGAVTSAGGVFSVTLTGTTLTVGQIGTLLIYKTDGTPGSAATLVFCGPLATVN